MTAHTTPKHRHECETNVAKDDGYCVACELSRKPSVTYLPRHRRYYPPVAHCLAVARAAREATR